MLCCPVQPDFVQTMIIQGQRLACFTHAGIYVGNGQAIDATMATDVSQRPFRDVVADGYVKALRLPGIPPSLQQAVCANAAQLTGSYSRIKVLVDGMLGTVFASASWAQLAHGLVATNGAGRSAFYCSELVNLVYQQTLPFSIVGQGMPAPVPAAFSATLRLAPVATRW